MITQSEVRNLLLEGLIEDLYKREHLLQMKDRWSEEDYIWDHQFFELARELEALKNA